jgi:hypothetical protein
MNYKKVVAVRSQLGRAQKKLSLISGGIDSFMGLNIIICGTTHLRCVVLCNQMANKTLTPYVTLVFSNDLWIRDITYNFIMTSN